MTVETAPVPQAVRKVKLPSRRIHRTPRLIIADAYTVGSYEFESSEALENSVYYITLRKELYTIDQQLYKKGDDRFVFSGLARLLDYLFYEPVTMEEIDETERFLAHAKLTSNGFENYWFPRALWEKVVTDFNGRPPIKVKALPEGSVFYPHEPAVEVSCKIPNFNMGVMAAWFESTKLMMWADTEFVTELEHFVLRLTEQYQKIYKTAKDEEISGYTRQLMTDFGARASSCPQEAEFLGESFLHSFSGTDTLAGAYQAWKNNGEVNNGLFFTVPALAHRNPQSYKTEWECYLALYEYMKPGDIGSFVADVYDFWTAVEGNAESDGRSLLELALRSRDEGNGKVVVVRPDSGIAVEQIIWLVRLALKHGLYETVMIDGTEWRVATTLRFIEGNGLSFQDILQINDALIEFGAIPHAWGLYGMGGHKRNKIARDNTSAKYALCAVGNDNRPVCKFSEELGKTTLPGPFIVRRDANSLLTHQTVANWEEQGVDARVEYFNGENVWEPFGPGFSFNFTEKTMYIRAQMMVMPLSLIDDINNKFPITDFVRDTRIKILKEVAPKKLAKNY